MAEEIKVDLQEDAEKEVAKVTNIIVIPVAVSFWYFLLTLSLHFCG